MNRLARIRNNQRTNEQADREAARAYLAKLFGNIDAGLCGVCGIEAELYQDGRCVYASPCGHRQYQGKVFA